MGRQLIRKLTLLLFASWETCSNKPKIYKIRSVWVWTRPSTLFSSWILASTQWFTYPTAVPSTTCLNFSSPSDQTVVKELLPLPVKLLEIVGGLMLRKKKKKVKRRWEIAGVKKMICPLKDLRANLWTKMPLMTT